MFLRQLFPLKTIHVAILGGMGITVFLSLMHGLFEALGLEEQTHWVGLFGIFALCCLLNFLRVYSNVKRNRKASLRF